MKTMKVIESDGVVGERQIDYVERHDDLGNPLVKPRSVPMLGLNEDVEWTCHGEAVIVNKAGFQYVYTQ